jgi:predicted nucleic acid-binding Zn ribbon protein
MEQFFQLIMLVGALIVLSVYLENKD